MKRDKRNKKNTEFAKDLPIKQSFSSGTDPSNNKKNNERDGLSELPSPYEKDLIINEHKSKSTSL